MSDYSDIATALKARLDTVANIGTTAARERWSADPTAFLDQFKATIGTTVQIRGWTVSLAAIESAPSAYAAVDRTYRYVIRGYMGFQDSASSETTFLSLVEAVLDALDPRTDLGVASVVDYGVGPATMTHEPRQFGSFLCHYAEIAVAVEVRKAVTYAAG